MQKEKIERICANCEKSSPIGDTDACRCIKHGIVKARSCCREFREDLFKVVPPPPVHREEYTEEILKF